MSSSCAWPRAGTCSIERPRPSGRAAPAGTDLFHPTVAPDRSDGWAEVAAAGGSRVVRFSPNAAELLVAALPTELEDAGTPAISPDGSRLGFIRTHRGRGQLWLLERPTGTQRPITSADWDVLDFGFFPDNRLVFAGRRGATPGLFVVGADTTCVARAARGVGAADAQPRGVARRTLARLHRARARKLAAVAAVAGSGRAPAADQRRLQQHQPRVAPRFQEPGLRDGLRARRRADHARRSCKRCPEP